MNNTYHITVHLSDEQAGRLRKAKELADLALVADAMNEDDILTAALETPVCEMLDVRLGHFEAACKESLAYMQRMREQRRAEMLENFGNETNEEWTQEWRDELTDEEAALVDQWDAELAEAFDRAWAKIAQINDEK